MEEISTQICYLNVVYMPAQKDNSVKLIVHKSLLVNKTTTGESLIANVSVLNDIACSDHLPLCIDINCDINPLYDNNFSDKPSTSKWHIATDIDKQNYHKCTGEILNTIVLPTEALLCKDTNCESHYLDIEHFYDSIVSSIQIATSKCIPCSINGSKFKVIPGWNDYVKESYAISRDALKWWISNNRPRDGLIYHNMRTSRAQFKYALRIAKRNEETARADALARDLYDT